METFIVKTSDGNRYLVTPVMREGKMTYSVNIDNHVVNIIGNPHIGGPLLVPEHVPLEIDLHKVEEIAEAIDKRFA